MYVSIITASTKIHCMAKRNAQAALSASTSGNANLANCCAIRGFPCKNSTAYNRIQRREQLAPTKHEGFKEERKLMTETPISARTIPPCNRIDLIRLAHHPGSSRLSLLSLHIMQGNISYVRTLSRHRKVKSSKF